MSAYLPSQPPAQKSVGAWMRLWLERLMAFIALINVLLVVVDLTYIPFRDVYLRAVPEVTVWYGETFKGIEPNHFTEQYLAAVDQLDAQVSQTGLSAPAVELMLEDLRQQSEAMIEEDPFQIAGKSGTLEEIKALMRDRVDNESSQASFKVFWSLPYLNQAGYSQALQFFNQDIRPLIETNYFRHIAFDGNPVDDFSRIDIWFIGLFAIDLLIRSVNLRRRYKNVTWRDAILWRWYDLLLLIPFSAIRLPWLRLIRLVPVTIRLDQSRLVNLQPLQSRISRFFLSQLAIELTEVILLRALDQIQNLIRSGEARSWLLTPKTEREYIDLNDVDELDVITQRLVTVFVDHVLPQVKPEFDTAVNASIERTLELSPGYSRFRQIPGLGDIPNEITRQLVAETSKTLYAVLETVLNQDADKPERTAFIAKLATTLRTEMQRDYAIDEIEAMAIALLEEIKINYVRKLSREDFAILQERRFRIYDVTQEAS